MTTAREEAAAAEERRLLQLRFVGEVLAVFVHETNNRLATLQETVGLLGDVLNAPDAGKAAGVRESLRVAAGLEGQIALLAELVRHLDGFGRRIQARGEAVELPAALEELLGLTSRLARQRGVRVERDFDDRLPAVRVEPVAFLFLVFHLLARALAAGPPQGTLRLRARRGDEGSGIGVHLPGSAGAMGLLDGFARGLALRLGGRIEEGADTVMIWFPGSV